MEDCKQRAKERYSHEIDRNGATQPIKVKQFNPDSTPNCKCNFDSNQRTNKEKIKKYNSNSYSSEIARYFDIDNNNFYDKYGKKIDNLKNVDENRVALIILFYYYFIFDKIFII